MIRENFGKTFDIPETVLMTQEEVNELPDNATVWIIWGGGNGPYKYKIVHPVSGGEQWENKAAINKTTGKPDIKGGLLDFVGKEKYHTWVWKEEHGNFRVK